MLNSFRQIVATPRKCVGREAPSRMEPSWVTSTAVWKSGG